VSVHLEDQVKLHRLSPVAASTSSSLEEANTTNNTVAIGMAGRNIGVAVDFSPCSKNALRWAANLAAPGDRLILIHAKPSYQYEEGVAHLWERDGSRTHGIIN